LTESIDDQRCPIVRFAFDAPWKKGMLLTAILIHVAMLSRGSATAAMARAYSKRRFRLHVLAQK